MGASSQLDYGFFCVERSTLESGMSVQIERDANKHLEQLTVLIWTHMGAPAIICPCLSLN